MSFRARVIMAFWVLLMLAMAVPYWYFGQTVRQDILVEAKSQAVKELDLILLLMNDRKSFSGERELDEWVKKIGHSLGIRITYIVEGRVVADTEVQYESLPDLDDHSGRPEVRTAGEGEVGLNVRYSATLEKELIYAARMVCSMAGLPGGVLRLSVPVSRVKDRFDRLDQKFLFVMAGTIVAMALLGMFLFRSMTASIHELAQTARAVGQGHYRTKIRYYPGKEFKPLVEAINAMASNIEEQITTIREQKGRLQAVLNAMAEGVMVLDMEGRIESCNPALATMFPDAPRQVGKKPLEATMRPEIQKAVDMVAKGGADRVFEQLDLDAERCVSMQVVPFEDDEGVHRVVAVFHDLTEFKRVEKMRRDFVANVSHELKTPLTSIQGYAETLLDSPNNNPEVSARFLNVIRKNAQHMNKMVQDLLALSRTEHARDSMELEPVSVLEVLNTARRAVLPKALEQGVDIVFDLPEGDLTVDGDLEGLVRVFTNLMENAVKYGSANSQVLVAVRDEGETLAFCVADQGEGIPEKYRGRVFERFYRLERDTASGVHKDGSAGLGLAICRHIVRGHGGEIQAIHPQAFLGEDAPFDGAGFLFDLRKA